MSVKYIKGEFLLNDVLPIASRAIGQISSDIKSLGMSNADSMLSLQGTIVTMAAIVVNHTKGDRTLDESADDFINKLQAVLDNYRNGSMGDGS